MANFRELAKLFCGELATKATIENCAEDFEWLADCGYDNAIGYGVRTILSNKTAQDWIEYYGEDVEPVVLAMAGIGWAKCSEDSSAICKAIGKAISAINEYRRHSLAEITKVIKTGIYEREVLADGQIKHNRVGENSVSWLFGYDEEKKQIYIDKDGQGVRYYKVDERVGCGYFYKILKTQVITDNFGYFCKEVAKALENEPYPMMEIRILEAIWDNVTPIRK